MSQENLEIVRRVYEGWSRGDFSAIDDFDPNIDFEMVDWPAPARARGIEEVMNHIEARGKGSGADVSALTASLWTIEGGKVVRLALYWDTARALEVATRQV
jgi:ketosteroid isomerase-like protein